MIRFLHILALLVLAALPARADEAGPLHVFAAASLSDALADIAGDWTAGTGIDVVLTHAGSSALARQIAQGAPADLFLSASAEWIDWAASRGAVRPETVTPFAGNRLVLVAPAGSAEPLALAPDAVLARLGPQGRLAIALPEAVPAGIHAREAFEALGLWGALAPRLAPAANVRGALQLVATGAAPLGIVYASDAVSEPRVRIVAQIPPQTHEPIRYVGAVTTRAQAPDAAAAFLQYLAGPEARPRLASAGFLPLSE